MLQGFFFLPNHLDIIGMIAAQPIYPYSFKIIDDFISK